MVLRFSSAVTRAVSCDACFRVDLAGVSRSSRRRLASRSSPDPSRATARRRSAPSSAAVARSVKSSWSRRAQLRLFSRVSDDCNTSVTSVSSSSIVLDATLIAFAAAAGVYCSSLVIGSSRDRAVGRGLVMALEAIAAWCKYGTCLSVSLSLRALGPSRIVFPLSSACPSRNGPIRPVAKCARSTKQALTLRLCLIQRQSSSVS